MCCGNPKTKAVVKTKTIALIALKLGVLNQCCANTKTRVIHILRQVL